MASLSYEIHGESVCGSMARFRGVLQKRVATGTRAAYVEGTRRTHHARTCHHLTAQQTITNNNRLLYTYRLVQIERPKMCSTQSAVLSTADIIGQNTEHVLSSSK